MKQLYGRTNKRNATKQIGNRVQRLERARLAAEQGKKKRGSEMPDINTHEGPGVHMNIDARYALPTSRNRPVNIYNFVRTHRGDPALTVSLRIKV